MRRILIVSPNFPPISSPEMHRVRMSLPHFSNFGWQAVILTVDPAYSSGLKEPDLMETVPSQTEIIRSKAIPSSLTRTFGVNSVGLRSLPYLYRTGTKLLARQHFDLVYFSTTMFHTMALGRLWRRRFSIPYVLDMQDPWVTDYYEGKPKCERPPKYWAAQPINKMLEAWTMAKVNGIIAVSERYHQELCGRYKNIVASICRTIPFGAAESDHLIAEGKANGDQLYQALDRGKEDGLVHGVYVGVLGNVMSFACRIICEALQRGLKERPSLFSNVRLHFIGTSYASEGKQTIVPIARELGLEGLVQEQTERVGYLTALRLLSQADFLLIPGTDDPGYTPSKVYPCILSKKPILALFHENSSAGAVLRETLAGEVVSFMSHMCKDALVSTLVGVWETLLEKLPFQPPTNWSAFRQYTAEEMTRKQCELFDAVVETGETRKPLPAL